MAATVKSIETSYKGYRFRSRLEARTAVLLDESRIPFMYEPEGFVFEDGTTYLPDFYLPDQDAFLECKGIMTEKDNHKIAQLAKATGKEVVIMRSDMGFTLGEYVENRKDICPLDEDGPGLVEWESWLCKCRKCGKKYFGNENLGWECKCCGYYDGDAGFEMLCYGYSPYQDESYVPLVKAKRARFEFGKAGD